MHSLSLTRRLVPWVLAAALLGAGLGSGSAMAQAEPTLNQVYATAQAGKLDQAQLMIQQVLISHPQSAKAHYVRAELYARQGDLSRARDSLATADKLSPGLSFAKPEAVRALRAQLAAPSAPRSVNGQVSSAVVRPDVGYTSPTVAPAPQVSSPSWGMPLLLVGIAIAAAYFLLRRRDPAPAPQAPAYGSQGGGLGGPQTFGMGGGAATYPQAGTTGSGLGGRILGGVATGLAVGAGVMAAEAIGRNLMGHHNADAGSLDGHDNFQGSRDDYQPLSNTNPDMGGADFGINDGGSWDSGGGLGGGGDWDN